MTFSCWIRSLLTPSAVSDQRAGGDTGAATSAALDDEPPCRPARPGTRTPRLEVLVCDLANEVKVSLKGEAGYLEAEVLSAALLPLSARRPPLVIFDLSE